MRLINMKLLLVFGFIFVAHFIDYSNADETQNKALYNCFKDTDQDGGTCEDTRITIGGEFYECETVIVLSSPPKRILESNGEVFFSVEGSTYRIYNNTEVENIQKIIPPSGEVSDSNGNLYFGESGTTFVIEKKTGKEIKIITSDYNGYSQYAIDKIDNKLFILSYFPDADADKTGQLFSISTDPLNIIDGTIKAELVKNVGDRITALAVQSEQHFLILGMKEDKGGKLIKLTRKRFDPCSKTATNKNAILDIIKEMQDKIVNLIDTVEPFSSNRFMITENIPKSLTRENQRLKRELQITNEKFKLFSAKLAGITNRLHPPAGFAPQYSPGLAGPPNLPPFQISNNKPQTRTTRRPSTLDGMSITDVAEDVPLVESDLSDCEIENQYLKIEIETLMKKEAETQQTLADLLREV